MKYIAILGAIVFLMAPIVMAQDMEPAAEKPDMGVTIGGEIWGCYLHLDLQHWRDSTGDGTSDIAVFRSSSGLYAVRRITRVYFGTINDQPVPADYAGDSRDDIGIFRSSSGLWAIRGISRVYRIFTYIFP